MPTVEQEAVISPFLATYFGADFKHAKLGKDETAVLKSVTDYVAVKFTDAKYVLGLAIDFTLLAQQLSHSDAEAKAYRKDLDGESLFQRYTLVTSRGTRAANTLTLRYDERTAGIRRLEEAVVDLFVALSRPGYPSAYVYNTGQWQKFQVSLLVPCFRLSESGRYLLCRELIGYGLSSLTEGVKVGRLVERVRVFDRILRDYPRRDRRENAGTTLQGVAAGFIQADRPHLSLVVDKTRTGSARQARIGDIDGYYGLDLELTCEVKDQPLTMENVAQELGAFLANVRRQKVMGLVVASSATAEAVEVVGAAGAVCLPLAVLIATVATWDWRKQDAAAHGCLHYLAHVEQNPDAVRRLLAFIRGADPTHDSLAHYQDASS